MSMHAPGCPEFRFMGMADCTCGARKRIDKAQPADAPIPLSKEMLDAVRSWAANDRLWGSRESTEFNLCTFARVILKAQAALPPGAGG
jgi:hypothetical protein